MIKLHRLINRKKYFLYSIYYTLIQIHRKQSVGWGWRDGGKRGSTNSDSPHECHISLNK